MRTLDLEEVKMTILRTIANETNGAILQYDLKLMLEWKIGKELYKDALQSLQDERVIKEETTVWRYGDYHTGHHWVITDFGKKKYNIKVRKEQYVSQRHDSSTGMLRVVGSGGQTLDYVSAPDKRECLYMCCGFIIVVAIIMFFALG